MLINPFYEKAFESLEKSKPDSAFLYFEKAKNLFIQRKDSIGIGKCLIRMSIISADRGDYFGGQEILTTAIDFFNKENNDHFAYIESYYNELGYISFHLRDYSQAISFYEKALIYPNKYSRPTVVKDNLANAYRRKKEYHKALAIYDSILKHKTYGEEFSRALANSAYTKWLQDNNYKAAPELLKALQLRIKENDLNGQNTSYAYLADYYGEKQPNVALSYATKMYGIAKKIHNPNDQLEALQKLIKYSPEKLSKKYFEAYQILRDSVQTVNNSDKNQFALIRYETEKNKADNLKLQKDNTEKKYQIIKRELLLYVAILLSIAGAMIGLLWYRKRKQRLQLEAQNAIQENKLRTSKKVHDVVANGLYRVMTEIENQEHINKEHILDKIEDMYEKSRDISYDQPQALSPNFNEKISELLSTFISSSRTVKVVGNTSGLWNKVSTNTFYEVEHILQELMVNMKKHSEANQVTLQFKQENNQLTIDYTDNGIGIQKDAPYGNGLKNTETRIKNISGTITFEPNTEKGLRIKLSFPIS